MGLGHQGGDWQTQGTQRCVSQLAQTAGPHGHLGLHTGQGRTLVPAPLSLLGSLGGLEMEEGSVVPCCPRHGKTEPLKG